MRCIHKYLCPAFAVLTAFLAALAFGPHLALAQEALFADRPQVFVTPYLWLPGIDTRIATPSALVPDVNSSVGAVDVLGHLDGIPFMGSAEIREGPIGFVGDVVYAPVATHITTRNIFFQGGRAALTMVAGTGIALYRVLEEPVQQLDAGFGFRAWEFASDLTLNGRLLPTVSGSRSASWSDPLLALRYHRDIIDQWGLTAYGDVGGFGVGAHFDWQVMGTLDYALSPSAVLRLGYRSLNFNYSGASGRGFNVNMNGPIMAATFRF
jgi:hypothetical protein